MKTCIRCGDEKQLNAQYSLDNKTKHIGYYVTQEEANFYYSEFKKKLIMSIANNQCDNRIKDGLLKHVSKL